MPRLRAPTTTKPHTVVVPAQDPEERERAMRRSLLLAWIGLGAWSVVVVIAVVLAFQLQPWWLWALLAGLGVVRLLADLQRMRTIGSALQELAED